MHRIQIKNKNSENEEIFKITAKAKVSNEINDMKIINAVHFSLL